MRPYGGGDEEARTPDPLRARQVLSHLSYTPTDLPRIGFFFEGSAFKIEQHPCKSQAFSLSDQRFAKLPFDASP